MCGLHRFYCWRHRRSWVTEATMDQVEQRRQQLIKAGWRIFHEVDL
jgi:hypothetical protein